MPQIESVEIAAAVVRAKGGPFRVEQLTLEGPRRDEVLVRVVATGMCHTDIVARDKGYDGPHPIVLGHEGAGVVEQVGSAVRSVSPGDHVVMSYQPDLRCKACLAGKHPQLRATMLAIRDELAVEGGGDRIAIESLRNLSAVHLLRHASALRLPAHRMEGALPR